MFGLGLQACVFKPAMHFLTNSVKIWSTSADSAAPFGLIKRAGWRPVSLLCRYHFTDMSQHHFTSLTQQSLFLAGANVRLLPPGVTQVRRCLCAIASTCVEAYQADLISLTPSRRPAFPDSLPRRGLQRLSHMSSSISSTIWKHISHDLTGRLACSVLHKAFLGECCPRETMDILSYSMLLLLLLLPLLLLLLLLLPLLLRMNVCLHCWGLLCSELPLLGTNPPTGVSVWVCAVSLFCSQGRTTCSEVVNERLID